MSLFCSECLTVGNKTIFFKHFTVSHEILPGQPFQKTICDFSTCGTSSEIWYAASLTIWKWSSLDFSHGLLESWRLLTDEKKKVTEIDCMKESSFWSKLEMMLWESRTRMSPVVYWEFQKHSGFVPLHRPKSLERSRKNKKNSYLRAPLYQISTTLKLIILIFFQGMSWTPPASSYHLHCLFSSHIYPGH